MTHIEVSSSLIKSWSGHSRRQFSAPSKPSQVSFLFRDRRSRTRSNVIDIVASISQIDPWTDQTSTLYIIPVDSTACFSELRYK